MCKVLFLHGNVFLRAVGNVVKLLLQHVFRRMPCYCRRNVAQMQLRGAFLQPTRRSTPSFHRPNAAAYRLSTAQMQLRAVFSQLKRSRTPSFRRLFASFNVHKFSIWTTDDIALRYSLTCYNVFTYQNSGKNVSVGPRDMFATCCFFLTSTNMVQCNQSC